MGEFSRGGKRCISPPEPSPALEQTGLPHARQQRCVNISGEPGAYRKVHAWFGEGRPETTRRNPRLAPDAYSTKPLVSQELNHSVARAVPFPCLDRFRPDVARETLNYCSNFASSLLEGPNLPAERV